MISIRALFKFLEIKGKYQNIAVDIKGAKYDTTLRKEVLSMEQMKNILRQEKKCLCKIIGM